MDASVVIVAGLASLGPTLMGLAAFLQARGANRAVNHRSRDEPPLVVKVDMLADAVTSIQGEMALVKRDLLKFNEIDRLGREGRIDRRRE